MKRFYLLVLVLIIVYTSNSQELLGAWQQETISKEGTRITNTITFVQGYFASSWYATDTGAFIRTQGGSWSSDGELITAVLEFDSQDTDQVANTITYAIQLTQASFTVKDTQETYYRIDSGKPGALQGAWLMSGRKRDGEIQTRDTSRSRKTMKILSGTRFQWIAYDTATKEFKGTGGGNYTTIDGKYTENIEFFSRDDSRVGASLSFTYEMVDGAWHHSGLSSKGTPIYEIWSTRE